VSNAERSTAGGELLFGEPFSVPRLPRRDQVEGETCQRQGEPRLVPRVLSPALAVLDDSPFAPRCVELGTTLALLIPRKSRSLRPDYLM